MKKHIIMTFITFGAAFAALMGEKVYRQSREERKLRDWEDQQAALADYFSALEAGEFDRDPRDYD